MEISCRHLVQIAFNLAKGSCTAASTEAVTNILHTMSYRQRSSPRELAESKNWYLFGKFRFEIPDLKSNFRDSRFAIQDPRYEI